MRRTVGRTRSPSWPSPGRGSRPRFVVALAALLFAGCHTSFSRIAPHARLDAVARVRLAGDSNSIGTAFFVAADVVVTARHVAVLPILYADRAQPPPALELAWDDGRRLAVRGVLGDDSEADLVCLKLGEPAASVTPIRVSASVPAPGEGITTLGYPRGGAYAASTGRIESSETTGWSRYGHWVETSARGAPGSSGSPMVDESGELLAVCILGSSERGAIGTRAERVRSLILLPETPWGEWAERVRRSSGEWAHGYAFAVATARASGAENRWRSEFATRLGLALGQEPFADEATLWSELLRLQPDPASEARVLKELDAWIARWPAREEARIAKIEFLYGKERYEELIAEYDRYRAAAPFRHGMGAFAARAALDAHLAPRLDAAYEAVLEEPGWAFAWRALARSRWAVGDLPGWAPAFLRYHDLRPDDPEAPARLGGLALALALTPSAAPSEALDAADEALRHELSPDNDRYARAAKALALAQLGEFAKAEASIADVEALGAEWGTWFRATIVELRRRATTSPK